jgi:hypothetical protein
MAHHTQSQNRTSDCNYFSSSANHTDNPKTGKMVNMARVKCSNCQLYGHFRRNCTTAPPVVPSRLGGRNTIIGDVDERSILLYGLVVWNSNFPRNSVRR